MDQNHIHTGPARREHQHTRTDFTYSHHTDGLSYNNKMIVNIVLHARPSFAMDTKL
jgi:hypothetical protein